MYMYKGSENENRTSGPGESKYYVVNYNFSLLNRVNIYQHNYVGHS